MNPRCLGPRFQRRCRVAKPGPSAAVQGERYRRRPHQQWGDRAHFSQTTVSSTVRRCEEGGAARARSCDVANGSRLGRLLMPARRYHLEEGESSPRPRRSHTSGARWRLSSAVRLAVLGPSTHACALRKFKVVVDAHVIATHDRLRVLPADPTFVHGGRSTTRNG